MRPRRLAQSSRPTIGASGCGASCGGPSGTVTGGGRARDLVEQRLGRAPRDDLVRHRVRVLLVHVAGAADPAVEVHPAALLHDVGRLVGRRVQVRRGAEGDCCPLA